MERRSADWVGGRIRKKISFSSEIDTNEEHNYWIEKAGGWRFGNFCETYEQTRINWILVDLPLLVFALDYVRILISKPPKPDGPASNSSGQGELIHLLSCELWAWFQSPFVPSQGDPGVFTISAPALIHPPTEGFSPPRCRRRCSSARCEYQVGVDLVDDAFIDWGNRGKQEKSCDQSHVFRINIHMALTANQGWNIKSYCHLARWSCPTQTNYCRWVSLLFESLEGVVLVIRLLQLPCSCLLGQYLPVVSLIPQ